MSKLNNNVSNIRRHSKAKRDYPGCAELSRAVGITAAHASYILSGRRTPSLPLALKIANHMGISLDEFAKRVVAA